MKNHEHTEFVLYHDLMALKAEQSGPTGLDDTLRRTQQIINENAITILQSAHSYVLIRRWGDLYPETRATLRRLLEAAIASLDDEEKNTGRGCGLA